MIARALMKQPHAHLDHGAEDEEDREDEKEQSRLHGQPFFSRVRGLTAVKGRELCAVAVTGVATMGLWECAGGYCIV